MQRIALVTNEPPPYRVPVFNRIASLPAVAFEVIFCCEREPNREWNLPRFAFDHVFLKRRLVTVSGRYIHNNPDVVGALRRFGPDVIVSDGMNPTQLYAFLYAKLLGIPYVPLTDGTDVSESRLGRIHVTARKFVYSRSDAFIAASRGGIRLFQSYGADIKQCFLSPLCADNPSFLPPRPFTAREFDLIFCGRMVEGKNPRFALRVAVEASKRLGRRMRMIFVGSGDLDAALKSEAQTVDRHVECVFHGFARQEELPALYANARLFLFPTSADVWGVVANEACAAGLPVIISPHAGAAGELVIDGHNGFVTPLDADLWADGVCRVLSDEEMWNRFCENSLKSVAFYSYDNAAEGIVKACIAAGTSRRPSDPLHA
jgi:glycosyltransferase involved in cell wall biosynthesis